MKEGFVIYCDKQGCGYVHDDRNTIEKHLQKVSISINNCTIEVGDNTTLNGHFTNPLEYIGLIGSNELVFYIGAADEKYFFQSVFKIQEDRIFEMYSLEPPAGRDFFFVNNKWK